MAAEGNSLHEYAPQTNPAHPPKVLEVPLRLSTHLKYPSCRTMTVGAPTEAEDVGRHASRGSPTCRQGTGSGTLKQANKPRCAKPLTQPGHVAAPHTIP